MYPEHIAIIGASAGGPIALKQLFTEMPRLNASIIIVQHMPDFINQSIADSLDQCTKMRVKLAENAEPIGPGVVYLAPSDKHLVITRNRQIGLINGEKVCFVRPSIDVAMSSLQPDPNIHFYGIVLTGMGKDGADGLVYIKSIGGRTIVQDEATSVIYGMPREAFESGAADMQLNPDAIRLQLIEWTGVLTA